ncbi:hypothetical protein PRIPAC_80011 [Pristionchus pacificus]|uniref:Uncharacterized protein n=1 Tax=Pristionchus pacificus TaxID=54126 RepID=A0A2A6C205_PRIPA|nr:hypothetical protein PRIPAC_80011 [Pristionchus pacificus]|eukprot:PDM72137.1 hypothetical protein PRIPAC_38571 [Pristionchus pacificus]
MRQFFFLWFTLGWLLMYACCFLSACSRFTAIVLYDMHEKLLLGLWKFVIPSQALQDFLDNFFPVSSCVFCLSLPYYTIFLPGPVNAELKKFMLMLKIPSRIGVADNRADNVT